MFAFLYKSYIFLSEALKENVMKKKILILVFLLIAFVAVCVYFMPPAAGQMGNERRIIDLGAKPSIPNGWTIAKHQKSELLWWDASLVNLYLSGSQQMTGDVDAQKLRKELKKQKVLNATILDFLLQNKKLIPKSWEKITSKGRSPEEQIKRICFWGTLYWDGTGNLSVRCMYFDTRVEPSVAEWRSEAVQISRARFGVNDLVAVMRVEK